MAESPLISIITATFNRSAALRLAIASALRSTLPDWELLVIGDACTDNSREVVESFRDSRIRFHNLEKNVGEQSGPNNEGMRRARGRYWAFLNHDDLWFPHHLEVSLETLRSSGADLVFGLGLRYEPGGGRSLVGAIPTSAKSPPYGVPASCWLFRRELFESVGPWRFYQEIRLVPSQDWLYRAHLSGARLQSTGRVTLLVLPSRLLPESYLNDQDALHAKCFEAMGNDPDYLEKELALLAWEREVERRWGVASPLKAVLRNSLLRLSIGCGLHPVTLLHRFGGLKKGAIVDRLRQGRGLPKLERQ